MASSVSSRYLDVKEFGRHLDRLRVIDTPSDLGLLEFMEQERMLVPAWRIQYPDTVSRAWWKANHGDTGDMKQPIEACQDTLTRANAFETAFHHWHNTQVYGRSAYPLDDIDPAFQDFIYKPAERDFRPWEDFRVEVSCSVYPELYDTPYWNKSLYASWNILLYCEWQDVGLHIAGNFLDAGTFESAWNWKNDAGRNELGNTFTHFRFGGIHEVKGLLKHPSALSALNWFAEEKRFALTDTTGWKNERRFLTDEEQGRYQANRRDCARRSLQRHQIKVEEIIALIGFLSERWADFTRRGRPLIAAEYNNYISIATVLVRLEKDWTFEQVRDAVGKRAGYFKPIMSEIFPSWAEEERERLVSWITPVRKRFPHIDIDKQTVGAFADWLIAENHAGFLWKLRACNRLLFPEADVPDRDHGINSEVQGLAVAVENVVQALGQSDSSLAKVLKAMWKGTAVGVILDRERPLTQRSSEALAEDMERFRRLRDGAESEKTAEPLLMAVRVRNASHRRIQLDELEAEEVIVDLLMAPLIVFKKVRGDMLPKTPDEQSAV